MNKPGYTTVEGLIKFLPALITEKRDEIVNELEGSFPEHSNEIIRKIASAEKLSADEKYAIEIIHEMVHNEAQEVGSINGLGPDNDVFPIDIMRYGPVFFIRAPEFDDKGYLSSVKEARAYAEGEFEPYITALAEYKVENDEED